MRNPENVRHRKRALHQHLEHHRNREQNHSASDWPLRVVAMRTPQRLTNRGPHSLALRDSRRFSLEAGGQLGGGNQARLGYAFGGRQRGKAFRCFFGIRHAARSLLSSERFVWYLVLGSKDRHL